MTMNIQSCLECNNGVKIPQLGLGMWQSQEGEMTQNAVTWALQAGYRHLIRRRFMVTK